MSLFDSINETNRAYCLHHVKRSMFLYRSMNYMVKNESYRFFTDLMDSYGFCSQSLQVWSTQGWHVCRSRFIVWLLITDSTRCTFSDAISGLVLLYLDKPRDDLMILP